VKDTQKYLHAYAVEGERFALLRGPARDLLVASLIHGRWDSTLRGYQIRADRLPDLLAFADTLPGWRVRVHPRKATP
jgi:hypothetical protein